jgi:hypothetical protein
VTQFRSTNKARPQSGVTFAGSTTGGGVGKIFDCSTRFPSARAVTAVPTVVRPDPRAFDVFAFGGAKGHPYFNLQITT